MNLDTRLLKLGEGGEFIHSMGVEGVMPLERAIIVGLCTAIATALLAWLGHMLVANLQWRNERKKYFREKLFDLYSEFVALAVADLGCARSIRTAMAIDGNDTDYTEAKKIEGKRHTLRLDLLRASLQIRLFEVDQLLAKKVEELAKAQPFMAFPFPPRWSQGDYNERSDRFDSEIATFEKQLEELIAAVLQQHSVQAVKRRSKF